MRTDIQRDGRALPQKGPPETPGLQTLRQEMSVVYASSQWSCHGG